MNTRILISVLLLFITGGALFFFTIGGSVVPKCVETHVLEIGRVTNISIAGLDEEITATSIVLKESICSATLLGFIERSTPIPRFYDQSVVARIPTNSGYYYFNGWSELLLPNGTAIELEQSDANVMYEAIRAIHASKLQSVRGN